MWNEFLSEIKFPAAAGSGGSSEVFDIVLNTISKHGVVLQSYVLPQVPAHCERNSLLGRELRCHSFSFRFRWKMLKFHKIVLRIMCITCQKVLFALLGENDVACLITIASKNYEAGMIHYFLRRLHSLSAAQTLSHPCAGGEVPHLGEGSEESPEGLFTEKGRSSAATKDTNE